LIVTAPPKDNNDRPAPSIALARSLLITEIFPPRTGGSGRWYWEVYRRQPREAVVIAAGTTPAHEEFDRSHDLNVQRLDLTLRSWGVCGVENLRSYGGILRSIRALAKSQNVKAIHCGRCLPEGLIALALKAWCGIPYVCFAHGEELNYATASRELKWLAKRSLNGAEFVIANSKNTERILRERWDLPTDQVRVLHPGVDSKRFVPSPRHESVRAALGWGNRPVVLTVGRLQRRKGHDQMIRALATIRQDVPDVLYAIIGDGDERERLEALVAEEGQGAHVQFLGEVDDETMVRAYQQCDLFALPNRQDGEDIEGFGMVLVEAQACGKPVIAGDSGGTAETLKEGETGRIVDCRGPEALAAVVTELLTDKPLREQMGAEARAWVVSRFDWDVLAAEAGRLFAELAGARR